MNYSLVQTLLQKESGLEEVTVFLSNHQMIRGRVSNTAISTVRIGTTVVNTQDIVSLLDDDKGKLLQQLSNAVETGRNTRGILSASDYKKDAILYEQKGDQFTFVTETEVLSLSLREIASFHPVKQMTSEQKINTQNQNKEQKADSASSFQTSEAEEIWKQRRL